MRWTAVGIILCIAAFIVGLWMALVAVSEGALPLVQVIVVIASAAGIGLNCYLLGRAED